LIEHRKKWERGASTVEFGLLVPVLFTLFLAIVQITIYIQSSIATQYAAFLAARSYQVYGTKKLGEIGYKRVESEPYTNSDQTIIEAAAEKSIFESLLWENRKIKITKEPGIMDRVYLDGNDLSKDGVSESATEGNVRVNALHDGVHVTYCAPIFAPGLSNLFSLASQTYPCKTTRGGFGKAGLAVIRTAKFGLEPEVLE